MCCCVESQGCVMMWKLRYVLLCGELRLSCVEWRRAKAVLCGVEES